MSSILTNNGAMVALATLRSINSNMATTQNEISTGKSVSSSRENSAVWAISKTMESDVKGFKAISDSLALGSSTVAVARSAAETITELLTDMKSKIVAAQGENVDRSKINTDVTALKEQIKSVVSAAQFNGLNLIDGDTGSVGVLASLDRDDTGNVSASSITVQGQDLATGGYTAKAAFTGSDGLAVDDDDAFGFALDATAGTDVSGTVVIVDPTYAAGDKVSMRLGNHEVSYTLTDQDVNSTSVEDIVAIGLKSAIEASGASVTVDYDISNAGTLVITNTGDDSLFVSGQFTNAGSGGLGEMAGIDVSTALGASAALGTIETLIGKAIDASAAFGSVQGRIDIQNEYVSSLTDSLRSGIGSLVDADMEETSAKLQALQVQQQLGIQALSIANQAPQNVLSLFR